MVMSSVQLRSLRAGGYSASDAAAGELGDPEDHELGRLHRGDADLDDQLAGVDRLGGLVSPSHLTKNASSGVRAEERAVAPDADQEGVDRRA